MRTRFNDAITAQSATNPTGLTNSLLNMQTVMIDFGQGTHAIKNDPACRLLAYQIATLFSVENMSDDLYSTLTTECEARHNAAQGTQ